MPTDSMKNQTSACLSGPVTADRRNELVLSEEVTQVSHCPKKEKNNKRKERKK